VQRSPLLLIAFLLSSLNTIQAQTKIVGECSLEFSIINSVNNDTIGSKAVFVKGDQCKTILQTAQLNQSLYFNIQQPTATITKDIGTSHFLQVVNYPPQNQPNLISMKETKTDSTMKIVGYNCKNIELKWSDGVVYQVWYTPEIAATVNTYELAFKEIPGLVLAYTIVPVTGNPIQYKANKIDLSPISLSQFNINTTLYQRID
jgi:GLPGLI family protein